MDGFEAGDREIPSPPVEVEKDTRGRMVLVLAAVAYGHVPEEVAGFLESEFPARITEALEHTPLAQEMEDHLNLLLIAMQSPAPTGV